MEYNVNDMLDLTNSSSLTEFQRNTKQYLDTLRSSKNPLLLTVNGKVEAVVLDPATFQAMEAEFERTRLIQAVKRGLDEAKSGAKSDFDTVVAEIRATYGL